LKPTTDVPDKASHIDSGDSSEEFEAFPFPDDQGSTEYSTYIVEPVKAISLIRQ
jgi:hypothetical protein